VKVLLEYVALAVASPGPIFRLSQVVGNGLEVTAKMTGLLLFMLGATATAIAPEVAPEGTVAVMAALLQELMVIAVPFSLTSLLPWEDPNPEP
jgi:hypothetical protein